MTNPLNGAIETQFKNNPTTLLARKFTHFVIKITYEQLITSGNSFA